jgi:hypothetical protein
VLTPFYSVSLVLIILLASIERIYGIDRQSLWSDELFAVMASYVTPFTDTWSLLVNDSHPPGYVAFMYWTLPLSNFSDFEIRLHALFFGIYWIPIVFYICKRWLTPDAGLLAAALTASAYPAIYFSQEARAYTMLITFILANLACFLEILFRPNPRKIFLYGFIVTTILSLYFHYSGFVFFSAEIFLYALLLITRQRKGNFKEAFQLFVIPLLVYSPWFVVMMEQVLHGHKEWAVSAPPTGNDAYMLMQRLLGPDYEHFQFYVLCFLIAGLLVADRFRRKTSNQTELAICSIFFLAAVPIFAFYLKSLVSTPIFEKRYFLHVAPFMAIIAAFSIDWALHKITNRFWYKPALTIFIVAYSAWTINTNIAKGLYTELDKDPIREATRLIKDDVTRNHLTDNYTTLMTYNWFEHYVRREDLIYDPAWKFHVFYISQQVTKVKKYLDTHPKIDYFYYLQFEQKNSAFAGIALQQQYKLLSKATLVTNSPFDISVLKFSAKESPSEADIKNLGSNPTNDAIKKLLEKTATKPAESYTVLYTHDWIEPYLDRNNIAFDANWPARYFYGDWALYEIIRYLDSHPSIDTVYYIALREKYSRIGADILATKYKLLDKFSTETSAGSLDVYTFDIKHNPTDAEIRAFDFYDENPFINALAALSKKPEIQGSQTYTFIYSHRWMAPYLIYNNLQVDQTWQGRHFYTELGTENILNYLNAHPSIKDLYYIALRNKETERTSLLLKLQYKLTDQTTFESGAGTIDIFRFDTKTKPVDTAVLKNMLTGSPLDTVAKSVASDLGDFDKKKSTIIMTHDWFQTYLRHYELHFDNTWSGEYFSNPDQLASLSNYLQAHPDIERLYFLGLIQPDMAPAIDALKSRMHIACEKTVDSPVGKLLIMRLNIKEAPTNEAVPVCKD